MLKSSTINVSFAFARLPFVVSFFFPFSLLPYFVIIHPLFTSSKIEYRIQFLLQSRGIIGLIFENQQV
ncbi:hypothetical protein L6452_11816 [Arctium lappa]|uniref:Uncharacterized protein n=1 Tax=Arctium lappa TaxID=4217 RepID=A0ACB9DQ65_ARCLA|nr:hypothetical protein L6452_11816 [Arctium lappa]